LQHLLKERGIFLAITSHAFNRNYIRGRDDFASS